MKLGHTVKRCPESTDKRAFRVCCSAAEYSFKHCRDIKCINCLLSNKKYKTLYDPNHYSSDLNCPCFQRARETALEHVDYGR